MQIEKNEKSNKLNIKNDLQDFWKEKEEIFKDDRIKIESYTNENNNKTNFNLNYDDNIQENKKITLIIILVIIIIGTIWATFTYNQEQKEIKIQTEKDKETLKLLRQKSVQEFNERMARKKQTSLENEKDNYNNYKYFKIKYETIQESYDRSFIYNIKVITSNLSNVISRENDNNYSIQISGHISQYGNFYFKIYKRKTSNEYDDEIINILTELKKIKFRIQEESIDFNIYLDNNSYDLN